MRCLKGRTFCEEKVKNTLLWFFGDPKTCFEVCIYPIWGVTGDQEKFQKAWDVSKGLLFVKIGEKPTAMATRKPVFGAVGPVFLAFKISETRKISTTARNTGEAPLKCYLTTRNSSNKVDTAFLVPYPKSWRFPPLRLWYLQGCIYLIWGVTGGQVTLKCYLTTCNSSNKVDTAF